eukprot:s959_g12.t1
MIAGSSPITAVAVEAMDLLSCVADQGDDDFVKAPEMWRFPEFVIHLTGDNLFPQFDLAEMLFGNAYAFPGLTLVADDHPMDQLLKMSEKLQEQKCQFNGALFRRLIFMFCTWSPLWSEQFPRASDIEADIKKQEESAVKEKKFKEDDEQQEEAPQMKLKFAPDLVIQSEQFLKRWCPKRPANCHTIPRVLPTVNEFRAIKNLPVDERWQLLALAGAGSFDPKLDSDWGPFKPGVHPVGTREHDADSWQMFGARNKLACVTAGKEFTWGANVPASTVVVTKSFAETTSVAGMLQYVGRAARRGLTTHGQAIFERDEDLQRIFASPDGLSTEALTMERYAEWWLSRGKELPGLCEIHEHG